MGNDAYARTPLGWMQQVEDRATESERRILPARLRSTGQQVTDWNTVFNTGFYWSDTGALNTPYADRWIGRVEVSGAFSPRRSRQTLSVPTTGATGRVEWSRVWSGVSWGTWKRSDNIMIPTACVGGTAAAQVDVTATNFDYSTGRYNFRTGDKYFAMDGVFTGEFRAYDVYVEWYTGVVNGAGARFRQAGAEIAPAAGYQYQIMYITGTGTPAGAVGSGGQGSFPPNGGQGLQAMIRVVNPMFTAGVSTQKRMMSQWASYISAQAATVNSNLVGYDTQALDGISIYNSDQAKAGVVANSYGFMYVKGIA
jgi:hypothetical protein